MTATCVIDSMIQGAGGCVHNIIMCIRYSGFYLVMEVPTVYTCIHIAHFWQGTFNFANRGELPLLPLDGTLICGHRVHVHVQ